MQGTQRSISRAQELIDEALSTPDSTVEVAPPQPERSARVPAVSTSSVLGNWSENMLPVGRPPPIHGHKRYSDVIPSSNASSVNGAVVPEPAKHTVTAAGQGSKRPQPASKELKPTGVASVPDTAISARTNLPAWTTSTFASITAATPSPTLQVSTSNSPTLEEHSTSIRSSPPALPPNTPSSGDSDEDRDRVLSPQGSVHSPAVAAPDVVNMEVGGAGGGAVDMNTEFPPLQSRSKSDPQVGSFLAKTKQQSQPSCDDITLPVKTQAEKTMSVTSSWPMMAPLPVPSSTPASIEDVSSPPLQSEKLPFVLSPPPTSPALEEESDKEGEASESSDLASPKTTTVVASDSGASVVSSLAVGTRPSSGAKSVAVTQATQQVIPN